MSVTGSEKKKLLPAETYYLKLKRSESMRCGWNFIISSAILKKNNLRYKKEHHKKLVVFVYCFSCNLLYSNEDVMELSQVNSLCRNVEQKLC